MAESPDHADGEKVEPINNNTNDSSATPETAGDAGAASGDDLRAGDSHRNLPMVLSPKLGAGEDETVEETAAKPEEESPAAAAENVQVSADTTLQQLKGELAALKAEVDSTMRGTNGQYSKIADRLDR